jgi:hypothetical protein
LVENGDEFPIELLWIEAGNNEKNSPSLDWWLLIGI